MAGEDEAAPEVAEGEAPPPEAEGVEGEEAAPPAEGEEEAEPPPAPKKKPKFFVHWDRKKAKFYDYNFDFGENYYSSVVSYLDHKDAGCPRRMAWAERGMYSSLARKAQPDVRTSNLLSEVRTSIRNFEMSQKTYVYESQKKFIK